MADEIVRRSPHRTHKPVTERDKQVFLESLAAGSTVRAAAESGAHPVESFRNIWVRDPEFAEAKAQAMDVGTDVIEQEAFRRAVEGVDEPVIGKVAPGIDGHVLGPDGKPMFVRRHSDKLAEVLLKGRRSQYRDNPRIDVTNQTLNVTVEDRSAALSEVAEILRAAGVDVGEIADGGGGADEVISGAGLLLAESSDV